MQDWRNLKSKSGESPHEKNPLSKAALHFQSNGFKQSLRVRGESGGEENIHKTPSLWLYQKNFIDSSWIFFIQILFLFLWPGIWNPSPTATTFSIEWLKRMTPQVVVLANKQVRIWYFVIAKMFWQPIPLWDGCLPLFIDLSGPSKMDFMTGETWIIKRWNDLRALIIIMNGQTPTNHGCNSFHNCSVTDHLDWFHY